MCENIRSLVARAWKDEPLHLEPGRHYFDEVLTVRVVGTVEKKPDEMIAPTVSIPLITTLALVLEKTGLAGDKALAVLTEALTEAMQDGGNEDQHIRERMENVELAIARVRKQVIEKLPKMPRSGRVITKDLEVEILPASALATPAAA